MPTQVSYTHARDNLAELLDKAELDREVVVVRRRGHDDVALVASAELESSLELQATKLAVNATAPNAATSFLALICTLPLIDLLLRESSNTYRFSRTTFEILAGAVTSKSMSRTSTISSPADPRSG